MLYLDSSDICILCDVLVLVKAIFCRLSLPQINAEFDKQDHYRLERGDRAVAGSLRRDMFVQ